MSRICYLAEPVDFNEDRTIISIAASRIINHLELAGWLTYRPGGGSWHTGGLPIGPETEEFSRTVLHRAGLMVAVLPSKVRTIGVPREIEYAKFMNVRTIVVTDRSGWALADCEVVTFEQFMAMDLPTPPLESPFEDVYPTPLQFMLSEGARLPTRVNEGDAGFDLYTDRDCIVKPGVFTDIPCGVQVALPDGVWARLTGRSSTMRTWNLLTIDSVIDTGYRGDLFSAVWNLTDAEIFIPAGTRLTQLILHTNIAPDYDPVSCPFDEFDNIPGDGRGTSGFGSSGT